jgi:nitroreductase
VTPDDVIETIRSRRTNMNVERELDVPHDLVVTLCELVLWAPNHRRTWPWRIAIVRGEGRTKLGEAVASSLPADADALRLDKQRTKYLRTPGVLVVGTAPSDSSTTMGEDRDATAAGIQNMLLGATAMGLATYWSSCSQSAHDAVATLCGFEAGTHITGMIYLGWPVSVPSPPPRPQLALSVVE